MSKLIGMAFFVGFIWVSMELHAEGLNGAFGGIFGDGSVQAEAPSRKTGKAAKAVAGAYAESEDRVDRLVGE